MEQARKELLLGRIEKQARIQAVTTATTAGARTGASAAQRPGLLSKVTSIFSRKKPATMPVYQATRSKPRATPLRAVRPSATAAANQGSSVARRVTPRAQVTTSEQIAARREALSPDYRRKMELRRAMKKTAMAKLLKKLAEKKAGAQWLR